MTLAASTRGGNRIVRRISLVLVALALALVARPAAPAEKPDPWAPLRFLVGYWESAPPDGSRGSSLFAVELGGTVLVRKNHAEYPPKDGRAAFTHDDELWLYREGDPAVVRGIYFDSEGHVIHYAAGELAAGRVTLVSDPVAGAPRYRLTYALLPDGKLAGTFAIAPPDSPDAFKAYLEWTCTRAAAPGSGKR